MKDDLVKRELDDIKNIRNCYNILQLIFGGGTAVIDEESKKGLKTIQAYNSLMSITYICSKIYNIADDDNLLKKGLNETFKTFFEKLNIPISNDKELSEYISLFRNAIAHHNDYFIDANSESVSFKKQARDNNLSIDFSVTTSELSDLAKSLLDLFKENPEIQRHFSNGLRLNNSIDKILNGESNIEYAESVEDLDLCYSFYISSLFEMLKYAKKSISKPYKDDIRNSSELSNILCGLRNNTGLVINDINSYLQSDETIESLIMFFYNAYPEFVSEEYKDVSYNNKSVGQLLDEYAIKISDGKSELTDFEIMIQNKEQDPQIDAFKQDVIHQLITHFPKIHEFYFSEDSIELLPNMETLLSNLILKSDKNKDEIVYWSDKPISDDRLTYEVMDYIRNAIMHGNSDVSYHETSSGSVEPVYSFQDTDSNNNDYTNFIITHITSEQLNAIMTAYSEILTKIITPTLLNVVNRDEPSER